MNTRIKAVRTDKKITQQAFADSLNVSKSTIESIEYGRREPSDRTLKDICRVYNVSYEWLTTGNGEMYVPIDRKTEIAEFTTRLMNAETEQIRESFTKVISEMNEAQLLALYDLTKQTAKELENIEK